MTIASNSISSSYISVVALLEENEGQRSRICVQPFREHYRKYIVHSSLINCFAHPMITSKVQYSPASLFSLLPSLSALSHPYKWKLHQLKYFYHQYIVEAFGKDSNQMKFEL